MIPSGNPSVYFAPGRVIEWTRAWRRHGSQNRSLHSPCRSYARNSTYVSVGRQVINAPDAVSEVTVYGGQTREGAASTGHGVLIISPVFIVLDDHLGGQCSGRLDTAMAHMPPHGDLNLTHSSLQSALQIDPNQQPAQPSAASPPTSRKRRKGEGDEPAQPADRKSVV